jgi:hypothetical protein
VRSLALAAVVASVTFNLSYPAFARYDPRTSSDAGHYLDMVHGRPAPAPEAFRPLVPLLARGALVVVRAAPLGGWPRDLCALAVVNAALVAAAALLVWALAARLTGSGALALVAMLLYLTQFQIANAHLAGLVDSAEALAVAATLAALAADRPAALCAILPLAVLGKETCLAVLPALALPWALAPGRPRADRLLVGVAVAAGLGARLAVRAVVRAEPFPMHEVHANLVPLMVRGFVDELANKAVVLGFCALVPLGVPGARRVLPRWFGAGTLVAVVAVLTLGAYAEIAENVGRPLASVAGPALAIGAAATLGRLAERRGAAGPGATV